MKSFTTFIFHSSVITKRVAEASQISLQDANVLQKILSYEEYCRRGVVSPSQSTSGVCAINPLAAFHDIHGRKSPHETNYKDLANLYITHGKNMLYRHLIEESDDLVWFPEQNKRTALLPFFHGCRKRRLKDYT
jgi:hypothetical protein